ncbi:PIN domain-containing protein [Nostoc sp.]|uniref:PIN domain-containing protein n=1 Tax=Nostoc sp. TaxID=1180 RepID=UPI002FF4463C
MRELFRGYYRPSNKEFEALWRDCFFCFDTNILLNIYRYSPKTRERLFTILTEMKDRIWIPYQVAYEYQEERLNVISQQLKPYSELQKLLNDNLEKFQKVVSQYGKRHSFSAYVDTEQIIGTIEKAHNTVKKLLADSNLNYPDLLNIDDFREELTNLFDGRVGQPYSEEDLAKVYKEAEKRFKVSQPPGYMDVHGNNKKEPPECYGDVVIWFQLIEYAKSQKKPLIFVTDDQKDDWWLERRGQVLGPRPELIQEMFAKAGVSFYLYTGEKFLDEAGNFLKLSSEPEVIEEARDVGLEDEVSQGLNEDVQHIASINTDAFQQLARSIDTSSLARLAIINTDTFQQLARSIDTSSLARLASINTDTFKQLARSIDTSSLARLASINTDIFKQLARSIDTSSLARLASINTDTFKNISSLTQTQFSSATSAKTQLSTDSSDLHQDFEETVLDQDS